jgi:sporulation protein YlmC with PRC-barrel domain
MANSNLPCSIASNQGLPKAAGLPLGEEIGDFMPHYGTLQDYRFTDADADDIRGSKIYGRDDEKLGKVDDVIFDHATGAIRYVVVDTGGWLSSKKFIVPADRLRPSVEHEDAYRVDLSKEQIESFPPYDESDVKDEDK